jgi:beta-glucanase (GH16 family)
MDVVKWNPITGVPRDFNFTSQKAWHQPENLEVSSGSLKISAKRLDTQYTGTWVTNWNTTPYITQTSNFDYTTGEISSKQRFGFGKYEIRAKIPFGKGFLPAFWTFGGVGWNEIDVFEITTDNPYGYAMDIHHFSGTQQQGSYGCQETWNGPNFSAVPHTFTMIWDFFKIEWYVDGNLIRTVYKYLTQLGQPIDCNSFQPFHIYIQNKAFPIEDMHIILSNAVLIGNNQIPLFLRYLK